MRFDLKELPVVEKLFENPSWHRIETCSGFDMYRIMHLTSFDN